MRIVVTLCLLAVAGCGGTASDRHDGSGAPMDVPRAPVSTFVSRRPAGCAGATAYNACFANDGGTPLALRVTLPRSPRAHAIAIVRFHRVWGEKHALDLDQMKFAIG